MHECIQDEQIKEQSKLITEQRLFTQKLDIYIGLLQQFVEEQKTANAAVTEHGKDINDIKKIVADLSPRVKTLEDERKIEINLIETNKNWVNKIIDWFQNKFGTLIYIILVWIILNALSVLPANPLVNLITKKP